MKTAIQRSLSFGILVKMAVMLLLHTSHAGAGTPLLPPGTTEFSGRLSHNHWQLLGDGRRAELDRLNRVLRDGERRLRENPSDQEGGALLANARDRLVELVNECPSLIRLDLTNPSPAGLPAKPVQLPGPTGALLIQAGWGDSPLHFSTAWANLSHPAGESSRIPVSLAGEGTSYVLVSLENVPQERTSLILQCRRPGNPDVELLLDVVTPPPGALDLTVLSDEDGLPTPAMVRLIWRTDGLHYRPSNGINFDPQFDNQGRHGGARAANLPAPHNGHFWCVPGPFSMSLAPGVWQIGVRRGTEHEVIYEDVTIRSGETVEKVLRPRRWVDMRERGWWSGDDHVHGQILSEADAERLLTWTRAEDVHLANIVKMGDIYRTYFEQRGFGPEYRVRLGDYVIVPGQECPRTHDQIGHTLALNITSLIRDTDQYYLYDQVFDAVHAQGGLSGYAHINSGLFHVHRDMSLNMPRGKVDFAEVLQFNQLGTELYYQFLNLGCKLTASAGSDVPWGGTLGEARVYAHLGEEPFRANAWFEAFGNGRTFVTSGPMIELRVNEALPGDELELRGDQTLRVRARAWADPRHAGTMTLEVVQQGDVIRRAVTANGQPPEVELEFPVEGGFGCWIAARAWTENGTSAHTTPVYAVRPEFRFWKHAALEELLHQREESLRQIEGIIRDAEAWRENHPYATDRNRVQLALQGDALRERIAIAREIYDSFRRQAEREAQSRATPLPR